MSIRKVTGKNSSLTVSATVVQHGIYKASQVTQPLVSKAVRGGGLLINKAHLNSRSPISRLTYDTEGQGLRRIYDFLGITSTQSLFVNKALDDSFELISLADVAIAQFVLGRNPTDTLTAADVYSRLFAARRTFTDSANISESRALTAGKIARDTQSFLDSIFIARVKNYYDTAAVDDTFKRLFTSFRRIEDSVGMLDNFYIGDGITYEEIKTFRDSVLIGSGVVGAVRTAGDPLENFSIAFEKYLDPDITMLDSISQTGLKALSDLPIAFDTNSLKFSKPITESLATDDSTVKDARKGLFETLNLVLTNPVFFLDKEFADITTMLDSMDLGDRFQYESLKYFSEALSAVDNNSLLIAHPTADVNIALDASVIYNTKYNKYINRILECKIISQIAKSIFLNSIVLWYELNHTLFLRWPGSFNNGSSTLICSSISVCSKLNSLLCRSKAYLRSASISP